MQKSNDVLAREMTAFCSQRVLGRGSRSERRPITKVVHRVVVAALLTQPGPGGMPWGVVGRSFTPTELG